MSDTPKSGLARLRDLLMAAMKARLGGATFLMPGKTRRAPRPRHGYPRMKDSRARDGLSIAAYDRSVTQRLANDPAFVRVSRTPRRAERKS